MKVMQSVAFLSEELGIRADRYYFELLSLRTRTSSWINVASKEMSRVFTLRYNLHSSHSEHLYRGEWFNRALEVYKELQQPPDHSRVVGLLSDMGRYYINKDHKLSEQCVTQALDIHKIYAGSSLDYHTKLLLIYQLFEVLSSQNKIAEADLLISQYLKDCENWIESSVSDERNGGLAQSWLEFGIKWLISKSYTLAFDYLSEAIRIFDKSPMEVQQHGLAEACKRLKQLGDDLQTVGKNEHAKEAYIRALITYVPNADVYDDKLDSLLNELGIICNEMGDYDEANNYLPQMVKESIV